MPCWRKCVCSSRNTLIYAGDAAPPSLTMAASCCAKTLWTHESTVRALPSGARARLNAAVTFHPRDYDREICHTSQTLLSAKFLGSQQGALEKHGCFLRKFACTGSFLRLPCLPHSWHRQTYLAVAACEQ